MNTSRTDSSLKPRNLALLGWLLLALAVLRIAWVVGHQPLAGYGNQYDMARVSACIGWWPVVEHDPAQATYQAPQSRYHPGPSDAGLCQWSADALIAQVSFGLGQVWESGGDGSVGLRWVGASKALLLVLALSLVQWQLSGQPRVAVAHALFAAVVIADPINTLWLNTLYTEFAALFGAYLAVSGLLLGRMTSTRPGVWLVLTLVGMAVLGFSRLPHLVLPLALAVLALWLLRPPWRIGLLLLALGAFVALIQGVRPVLDGVRAINQANVVLATLLPAAPDPARFLDRLDLPASCEGLARLSFYNPRGRDIAVDCPGLGENTHSSVALAVVREPVLSLRLIARSLFQSTAWRSAYVGELAGQSHARLPSAPWGVGASLASGISGLSFTGYLWLVLLPVMAGVVVAGRCLLGARGGSTVEHTSAADLMAVTALLLIGMVAVVSVLGDGFSELPRHLHLAINAVLLGLFVLASRVMLALTRLYRCWRDGGFLAGAPALLAALLPVLLVVPAVELLARQPQATGAIEIPPEQRFTAQDNRLVRGWAVDPFGIERVEAVHGGRSLVLPLEPTAELEAFYPIDRRHSAMLFELALDGTESGQWDFVVVNRLGVRTLVDRRLLTVVQPAPDP